MSIEGDWDEAEKWLAGLNRQMTEVAPILTRTLAESVASDVKEKIEGQRYAWPALVPSTVAYKKSHSLDPRILIATRTYVDNIGAYETDGGWYAGVPAMVLPGGITLAALSSALEFGTETMPARPHWTVENTTLSTRIKALFKMYSLLYKEL